MAETTQRRERKSRAIALGLAEALRMVEQIHHQGGGAEVPKDSLGHIVESKPTSSLFDRKLAALKAYGLIDTRGDMVALAPLGTSYAMPTSPEQKNQLALEAFRNIPLFEKLLNQYGGKPLPETNQFFRNLVASTYGIPQEEVAKWLVEFIDGARRVGVLVSEDGRSVIRLLGTVGAPSFQTKGNAPAMNIQESSVSISSDVINLHIHGAQMKLDVPDRVDISGLEETIGATEDALQLLKRKLERLKKMAPSV